MFTARMSSDYNRNSSTQGRAAVMCVGILTKTLEQMFIENPKRFKDILRPFHIADLGSADGANSICILLEIVRFCREKCETLPIKITVNDTPINDFNKLFQTLNERFGKHPNI